MFLCLLITSLLSWFGSIRWFGNSGQLAAYLQNTREWRDRLMKAKLVSLPGAIVTGAEDLHWIEATPGDLMALRIHSRDVAGAFTVVEARVMPFSGPPLHVHHERDEIFEVLEGRFRFLCGEETFDIPAGTTVVVPRGVSHAWVNLGMRPARLLFSFVPGGIDGLFEEIGRTPPDQWAALAALHDTDIVGPPVIVEGAAEPCRVYRGDNVAFLMPLP
jgi:mannose-6-phosphate isomerase-like protein (cupin superfamily)